MRRGVLAAAGVGLLLRLLVLTDLPTEPFSDFTEYFAIAKRLVFAGNLHGMAAMHPPGYPLVLAASFLVTPAAWWLSAAKVANALLGVATILLGAALARRLWGERAALVAAWLIALYPRLLVQPTLLASENLFTPLLVLFVLVLIDAPREKGALPRAALAGAIVAALALTRTVAYYIPLIWVATMIAGGRRMSVVVRDLVVLLAVQHALLLPWALRNRADVGRFTFLTTSGGMGLFIGNNDHATGDWYPWSADLERLRPDVVGKPAAYVDEAAGQEALRWMKAHPGRAVALYFRKLLLIVRQDALAAQWATAIPGGRPDVAARPFLLRHAAVVVAVVRVSGAVLGIVGLAGCVLLLIGDFRSAAHRVTVIAYLGTIAFIPGVSAWIAVNGRYRWPVEDLLLPLAALALLAMREKRAYRQPSGETRTRIVART